MFLGSPFCTFFLVRSVKLLVVEVIVVRDVEAIFVVIVEDERVVEVAVVGTSVLLEGLVHSVKLRHRKPWLLYRGVGVNLGYILWLEIDSTHFL